MLIIFLVLSGRILTANAVELAVYYSIPGGAMLGFIFSLLWLPVTQLRHLLLVLAPLVLGPGGKFVTLEAHLHELEVQSDEENEGGGCDCTCQLRCCVLASPAALRQAIKRSLLNTCVPAVLAPKSAVNTCMCVGCSLSTGVCIHTSPHKCWVFNGFICTCASLAANLACAAIGAHHPWRPRFIWGWEKWKDEEIVCACV